MTKEDIYTSIHSFVSQNHDSQKWLTRTDPIDSISVHFFKIIVTKINFSKMSNYYFLAIPNRYDDYFSSSQLIRMKPVKDWFRIPVFSTDTLFLLNESYSNLYSYMESEYNVNDFFGCCHQYNECSDAKQCLHPNVVFSNRCWYKTNMNKGLIFYGKNRNI